MRITSSMPSGSSSTTAPTRTRARRRADHAGEQALAEEHHLRVGVERGRRIDAARARPAGEGGGRPLAAEEARGQRDEVGQVGRAPPDLRGIIEAEGIDEQGRLRPLDRALPGEQRHAEEGADVGEHGPEDAVRHRIEPGQAEQRVGLQQGEAEQAVIGKRRRQRAGLRQRRQELGIEPDQEAQRDAGHRARLGGAAPEQAADDGRRELRDSDEGHQADRDQRVTLAVRAHVEVAERHQPGHRGTANPEKQAREIRPAREAEGTDTQQRRHHHVVAHHQAQRRRLNHHHARRRRQSAEEGDQRQHRLAGRQRHRQHQAVGIGAGGHDQPPGNRDRQDEEIDRQQVEREEPERAIEMALVDILHDHDLELARQAEDGGHGEEGHGDPVDAAHDAGVLVQRLDGRRRGAFGEEVAEAMEDAIGHEQADGGERHQLEDRFEGDRDHHAGMVLVRMEAAAAEEHGEDGEHQRRPQGAIGEHRDHALIGDRATGGEHVEGRSRSTSTGGRCTGPCRRPR